VPALLGSRQAAVQKLALERFHRPRWIRVLSRGPARNGGQTTPITSVACPKSPCVGQVPLVRTTRKRSAVLLVSPGIPQGHTGCVLGRPRTSSTLGSLRPRQSSSGPRATVIGPRTRDTGVPVQEVFRGPVGSRWHPTEFLRTQRPYVVIVVVE
jgi:hypothetical protein